MATSGTYAFGLQVDDLLTEAWERIGLNPEALSARHSASALRSLQLCLLGWTNAGLNLWQVDQQVVALPAGTGSFTTPLATSDILEAVCTYAGSDLSLTAISRDQWVNLPRKLDRGRPTSFWVERVNPTPVVHLWPVPDQTYSLSYSRIRLPQDTSALSQTADAPVLWLDALAGELARRLAVKFKPDRAEALTQEAALAYELAAKENRERVPWHLTPDLG